MLLRVTQRRIERDSARAMAVGGGEHCYGPSVSNEPCCDQTRWKRAEPARHGRCGSQRTPTDARFAWGRRTVQCGKVYDLVFTPARFCPTIVQSPPSCDLLPVKAVTQYQAIGMTRSARWAKNYFDASVTVTPRESGGTEPPPWISNGRFGRLDCPVTCDSGDDSTS